MARLDFHFSVPLARESVEDYVREIQADVLEFNEELTQEHEVMLDLAFSNVTDAQLTYLPQLNNLATLHLAATDISDDGLKHLCAISRLKGVTLDGCHVSQAAIRSLNTSLPATVVRF